MAGIPATSSSSPAMPTSITRRLAWPSSAGCWRPRASASASSPSRTGSRKTTFMKLGRPNLFFGVTAGNMDSMINRYTAERKPRSDDAYTPGGMAGKRPDRGQPGVQPALPGGLAGCADRARRHRGLAAPHRPLRLLAGSRAPFDPDGRQRRHPAVRQRRAGHGRGGPPPGRGHKIADITDVRGTAFIRRDTPADW